MVRRWAWRVVVVGGIVAALGWYLAAGMVDEDASVHARLHAGTVIAVLVVAGAIRARWPTAGLASWAPAIGLCVFAVGQAFEAVGAFGFNPAGRRESLAGLHDIGLSVSPLGMLAIVVGIAIGLAVGVGRQAGPARWVGRLAAVTVLVGGLVAMKMLTGL